MSEPSEGPFDLTVMTSVGHNHSLEVLLVEEEGLILAEEGLPNKSIFVLVDNRLQLEALRWADEGLGGGELRSWRVGGGGGGREVGKGGGRKGG